MIRLLVNAAAIIVLMLASSCSTGDAEITLANRVEQPSTTERPDAVPEQPPLSGSVGDPENPIGILEDGSTFDPAWQAIVTLTCGPDSDTRSIKVFNADTNNRGVPTLYRQEPAVGGGGVTTEVVDVGSVVPADSDFAWSIQGILLGPWPVDVISDECG